MYKVRHLARAHGKNLQVLMRMSLALLSNHAISRHWVLYVELIGPETLQRFIVPDTQSLGKCWISVEQYGRERSRIFLFTWFI